MTQWQKSFTREPPKTKADLREMLAEAVRNTQPETKPQSKSKRDRGYPWLYCSRLQGSRSINKIVVFAPWSPRIRALDPKARGMASQSRSFAGGLQIMAVIDGGRRRYRAEKR